MVRRLIHRNELTQISAVEEFDGVYRRITFNDMGDGDPKSVRVYKEGELIYREDGDVVTTTTVEWELAKSMGVFNG